MNCEDFRGLRQELSAKVINEDSSRSRGTRAFFP